MDKWKYNIVFCYCQYGNWIIFDILNKKNYLLQPHEFRDWHEPWNIYIIYRQNKHLLNVGNYIYFDLYNGITIEKLMKVYNTSAIESMIKYFLEDRQEDFDAHLILCRKFGLNIKSINKSKAKLAEEILYTPEESQIKEFKNIVIKKYVNVAKKIGNENFETKVAGLKCKFGMGGVHAAKEKYIKNGYFINLDVVSMYPSIILNCNLLGNSKKYKKIYDEKIKTNSKALKIVLNATFGAMNEPHNKLYNPKKFKYITKIGQLLILDLIERLEEVGLMIVQANTDSVLVKMPSDWGNDPLVLMSAINNVGMEWSQRTGLKLKAECLTFVAQKDVNNYVVKNVNNDVICRGIYVRDYKQYDRQTPVINKAIRENLINNKAVEDVIYNENKGFEFIAAVSEKYSGLYLGDKLIGKAAIVYASKNGEKLKKKNIKTGKLEKVSNSPDSCGNTIDKEWYVKQAKKRLKEFGKEL